MDRAVQYSQLSTALIMKMGDDVAMALLHATAEEGKLLLERGEDIDGRNASNQTPLKIAAGKGEPRYRTYSS